MSAERLIPESELRKVVRVLLKEELIKALAGDRPEPENTEEEKFIPTAEAAAKIGISKRALLERRQWPEYKYGVHWVNDSSGTGKGSRIKFNVEACRKVRAIPPEKLQPRE